MTEILFFFLLSGDLKRGEKTLVLFLDSKIGSLGNHDFFLFLSFSVLFLPFSSFFFLFLPFLFTKKEEKGQKKEEKGRAGPKKPGS